MDKDAVSKKNSTYLSSGGREKLALKIVKSVK